MNFQLLQRLSFFFSFLFRVSGKQGLLIQVYDPNSWEAEAGGGHKYEASARYRVRSVFKNKAKIVSAKGDG